MKKTTQHFFFVAMAILLITFFITMTLKSSEITGEEKIKEETNQKFEKLEEEFDAHLGVYGIDTETNKKISFNEEDRFAFASTFKALAGGFVLRDYSWEQLNANVMIKPEDIVDYSPITEKYVGVGMPLKKIVAAAMDYSDNTAGNFLFKHLEGPKGYQGKLENIHDLVTDSSRYSRYEHA